MHRLPLALLSLIMLVGCAAEEVLRRPPTSRAVYIFDNPESGESESIHPDFVILDDRERPVDQRTGRVLRVKLPEPVVSEEQLVDDRKESASNQLRMKFKHYSKDTNTIAGRPVVPRKKSAKPK